MVYKDKNYRDKRWIDKEIKEGSVVEQSKVFKCNSRSFYGRSKATSRRKFEGNRLNGSAGKRSKICREDGASRIPRGSGWNKEQRTVIRKQGEDKRFLKGWAGSRSKSCHQDGASRPARSKT